MIRINRQLTNSDAQLTQDFGEYPLRCFDDKEDRFNDFYITRTSPINNKLNDLRLLVRFFSDSEWQTKPSITSQDVSTLKSAVESMDEAWLDLRSAFTSPFSELFQTDSSSTKSYLRVSQYLSLPFIVLVLFLLAIFIIFFLLPKLIFKLAQKFFLKSASTKCHAFFTPIGYNGSLEIHLCKKFRKHEFEPLEESLISHEHLHLLQHAYYSRNKTFPREYEDFRGENTERLKRHLRKCEHVFAHLAYLYKIVEMEARLHEIVLSYYRSNRSLPTSQNEFQEMLHSAKSLIGQTATELFNEQDAEGESHARSYTVRCDKIEFELCLAILYLKDLATKQRFFLQVLPVMYSNLLVLYGYTNQARDFLETVECKDLFLELYGELAIPEPLRARVETGNSVEATT